jgi:hypothetical protein
MQDESGTLLCNNGCVAERHRVAMESTYAFTRTAQAELSALHHCTYLPRQRHLQGKGNWTRLRVRRLSGRGHNCFNHEILTSVGMGELMLVLPKLRNISKSSRALRGNESQNLAELAAGGFVCWSDCRVGLMTYISEGMVPERLVISK